MIAFISLSSLLFLIVFAVLFWQLRQDKTKQRYIVFAGIVSLVPITLMVYQFIGSPQFIEPKPQPQAAMPAGVTADDINKMVARLEQRLQGDTDDVDGLAMLARSYRVKGEFEKSIQTYQRLFTLQPDNVEWLMSMVEIHISTNNGAVDDDALQWLQTALLIQPELPNALWLAGLAHAQRGNKQQAQQHWLTLVPLLEGLEQQQELLLILEQLKPDQLPAS